ncbi:hypothetical protein [Shimia sediminis]|uniref:hypothetical protein n=1 Tax=Shimia sediminis TaxID=2497945 RepID=UPI000F8F12E0|nr:hypothetical protein [Shimia sediminis]
MGYRGHGYLRNEDIDADASNSSQQHSSQSHHDDDGRDGHEHGSFTFVGYDDDSVEGGSGHGLMAVARGSDVGVFSGSILDYQVICFGWGCWNLVRGADGCDFLHSHQILQFDDFTLDLTSNSDPVVIIRDDGAETPQGEGLKTQAEFFDLHGTAAKLVSASVTGGGTLYMQSSGVSQIGQIGIGGGTSVSFNPGNAYDGLGAGERATETVTLVISDGKGNTTTVVYDITIQGQSESPLAVGMSSAFGVD